MGISKGMAGEYYVMLTGGKNNAGDFLIKNRARKLMSSVRPDRNLEDLDGWKELSRENLDRINGSKALILMGGPALQKRMRPRVYGLPQDLNDITVPIVTMGIGWYSPFGRWEDTSSYPLNSLSTELLERINGERYMSSVRDYHTLNALASKGLNNFVMTGCPALYSSEHADVPVQVNRDPQKIGFSLGVSLKFSRRMREQMKATILRTRNKFPDASLDVVFHHGLGSDYLLSDRASNDLHASQLEFAQWLESEGISYVDISGDAEKLLAYYSECDLHIGYRIHAHIFMSSISKPSILLIEDGRGMALKDVVGGVNLVAYRKAYMGYMATLMCRVGIGFDKMLPPKNFLDDYSSILNYEMLHGVRFGEVRDGIRRHYPVMDSFLRSLP
jgi:polysaccharide pyruvyl transferase